jgi:alpha-tubulin suppressor-like RCC1 family protein
MRDISFKTLLLWSLLAVTGCSQGGGSSNAPAPNNPTPVVPNPPVSAHFVSGNQTIISKACSSAVKIETTDVSNNPANAIQQTNFSLSGTGLTFYSDLNCLTPITTVSLVKGSSQAKFYTKTTTLGNFIISVTEPNFGQIYQQLISTIGPASKITVITQPVGAVAGQNLNSFSAQIQDAYGNNVNQQGSTITLAVNTQNVFAYGTLSANTSATGLAQFNSVSLHNSGTFSLSFSSPNLIPANSDGLTINPASPVGIIFTSLPASGTVNSFFNPSIKVAVVDQYFNVNTSVASTEKVSIASYSDSGCSTAKGSVTPNNISFFRGIADFNFVTASQFGSTYFKASSTSFGSACSSVAVVINPQLGLVKNSVDVDSSFAYDVGSLVKGGAYPYSFHLSSNSTIGSSVDGVGFFQAGLNSGSMPVTENVVVTDNQNQQVSVAVKIYPALLLNIPNSNMVAGTSQQLFGSGGQPPYSYSIYSGGGSLDSSGVYTAPQTTGPAIIRLSDISGAVSSYQIQIKAALAASAPEYNILLSQSSQITASGGVSPYSYSVISGAGSVSPAGLFHASSTSGVTKVKVQDSNGNNLTLSFIVYSGGATHLTFSGQPGSSVVGENLSAMPIVLALNNTPDLDYTYNQAVTLELYDSTCSSKISNQSFSLIQNSFMNGRFQPEVLKINSAGTFTIKVTQGDLSVCSNSFIVSAGNHKVYAGKNNVCKVDNGALQCLGSNDFGQLTSGAQYSDTLMPIATTGLVTEVVTGPNHICAIDNGQLKCWGSNASGQLGSSPGSLSSRNTVSLVNGIGTYSYGIALGDSHSCSVIGSNLNCFGNDDYHQLGRGSPTSGPVINCLNISNQNTCQNVGCQLTDPCVSNSNATSCGASNQCNYDFSTGICHTTSSSQYACQGTTSYSCETIGSQGDCSNLGCDWSNGSCHTASSTFTSSGYNPLAVLGINGVIMSVAASANSNCAVIESEVFCWGDNASKQAGSAYSRIENATQVLSLENATQVTMGKSHSCAVNNNQAYCWGANDKGQLGVGSVSSTPNFTPQLVTLSNVKKVVAGDYFSCALNFGGSVYCWGANNQSQLGLGTVTTLEASPKMIALSNVLDIGAGGSSACAITSDYKLYCWGFNNYGHTDSVNPINYSSPTWMH